MRLYMKKIFAILLAAFTLFACTIPDDLFQEKPDDEITETPDDQPSDDPSDKPSDKPGDQPVEHPDSTTVAPSPGPLSISGFAQKGQLINGSLISAYALDSSLVSTGESFQTKTTGDMGEFILECRTSAPYLELNAQGYYFDEYSSDISSSPIYLQALAPNGKSNVNINLLTSLITPRMKKLMAEGLSFNEAELQAQSELMKSTFGYEDLTYQLFADMNIAGSSNSDAILLAASCLVHAGRSTSAVQSLISDMAASLEKDGAVSPSLVDEFFMNAEDINFWRIARGLVEYYEMKNIEGYDLPPFYLVLNEEYETGIHFLSDGPQFSVDSSLLFGCNVNKEGKTVTNIVLSTEDFDVVSTCDWIQVKKTRYIADFYIVEYEIMQNEGDIREGAVQYFVNDSQRIEYEDTFKQMGSCVRLYVELPVNGTTKSVSDEPERLQEGDEISVNGQVYKVLKDDLGLYVNVEQPAGMYRVCYPVASTYKDGNGNDVSFTPVESTDDFYYCNITYPETGYPAGVYPYYGIVPHTGDVVKVKMKPCFVGVRLIFEGVSLKDNMCTITSDRDIFGSFDYSIYLDEQELILNPSASLREPVVKNGVRETVAMVSEENNPSGDIEFMSSEERLSTALLLIPPQNFNFMYYDMQMKSFQVSFDYHFPEYDGREFSFCAELLKDNFNLSDAFSAGGRIIEIKVRISPNGISFGYTIRSM